MITRRSSLLVLYTLVAHCTALVPLIGWSNRDAFVSMKASQYSSASEFIYNAKLDAVDVIVVFKSPELSFDSLAKYGRVFGDNAPILSALQFEMKGSESSVWTGVEGNVASDLISTLSFILEVQPHVVTGAEGITSQRKLIQVELTGGSDEDGFVDQDDVISKVMSALNSLPNSPSYAAIYTSSHTHLPRPGNSQRMLRSARERDTQAAADVTASDDSFCGLLSNSTNDTTTGTTTDTSEVCMLFCFTSPKISVTKNASESIEYIISSVEYGEGSCNATDPACEEFGAACIQATVFTTNGTSFDLMFTFPTSNGFWHMVIYDEDSNYTRVTEAPYIFAEFSIPDGVCYACGDNDLNAFNNMNYENGTNEIQQYRFFGLQVQVYGRIFKDRLGNQVFGSAWNCQSYITTVPFMGVISTLFIMLVLYCAIVAMFSTKSLDRFDDARAPTISVENLH